MLFTSLFTAFGIVTFIFAILEKKGVSVDTSQDFSNLPPVPKKKEGISKADTVFEIIANIAFPIIFLLGLDFFRVYSGDMEQNILIFNTNTFKTLLFFIILDR